MPIRSLSINQILTANANDETFTSLIINTIKTSIERKYGITLTDEELNYLLNKKLRDNAKKDAVTAIQNALKNASYNFTSELPLTEKSLIDLLPVSEIRPLINYFYDAEEDKSISDIIEHIVLSIEDLEPLQADVDPISDKEKRKAIRYAQKAMIEAIEAQFGTKLTSDQLNDINVKAADLWDFAKRITPKIQDIIDAVKEGNSPDISLSNEISDSVDQLQDISQKVTIEHIIDKAFIQAFGQDCPYKGSYSNYKKYVKNQIVKSLDLTSDDESYVVPYTHANKMIKDLSNFVQGTFHLKKGKVQPIGTKKDSLQKTKYTQQYTAFAALHKHHIFPADKGTPLRSIVEEAFIDRYSILSKNEELIDYFTKRIAKSYFEKMGVDKDKTIDLWIKNDPANIVLLKENINAVLRNCCDIAIPETPTMKEGALIEDIPLFSDGNSIFTIQPNKPTNDRTYGEYKSLEEVIHYAFQRAESSLPYSSEQLEAYAPTFNNAVTQYLEKNGLRNASGVSVWVHPQDIEKITDKLKDNILLTTQVGTVHMSQVFSDGEDITSQYQKEQVYAQITRNKSFRKLMYSYETSESISDLNDLVERAIDIFIAKQIKDNPKLKGVSVQKEHIKDALHEKLEKVFFGNQCWGSIQDIEYNKATQEELFQLAESLSDSIEASIKKDKIKQITFKNKELIEWHKAQEVYNSDFEPITTIGELVDHAIGKYVQHQRLKNPDNELINADDFYISLTQMIHNTLVDIDSDSDLISVNYWQNMKDDILGTRDTNAIYEQIIELCKHIKVDVNKKTGEYTLDADRLEEWYKQFEDTIGYETEEIESQDFTPTMYEYFKNYRKDTVCNTDTGTGVSTSTAPNTSHLERVMRNEDTNNLQYSVG